MKSTRIRRLVLAMVSTAIVVGSSAGGVYAQTVNPDVWAAFASQQPLLSRILLAHEESAVANLLGISVNQLQTEATGSTLAQVAENHGKSADEVTRVMQATASGDVQTAASLGLVRSDTVAELNNQIATVIPQLVTTPVPTDLPDA